MTGVEVSIIIIGCIVVGVILLIAAIMAMMAKRPRKVEYIGNEDL